MLRIFLIHGYVENPTIFDRLSPLLPAITLVRIDLASEFLRWQPAGRINVRLLAQYLTDAYAITASDVLIGHSMGGWIGIHIKQLTNAKTVQIASWTDPQRIRLPLRNLGVLKFLLYAGVLQSRPLLRYFLKKYPFPESADLYGVLVDGMKTISRRYMYQQFRTLLAEAPPLTVRPDLRIHARRDNIIAPPTEPFVDVPGDHFSLVYHPEQVAAPIRDLLSRELV